MTHFPRAEQGSYSTILAVVLQIPNFSLPR